MLQEIYATIIELFCGYCSCIAICPATVCNKASSCLKLYDPLHCHVLLAQSDVLPLEGQMILQVIEAALHCLKANSAASAPALAALKSALTLLIQAGTSVQRPGAEPSLSHFP